MRDEQGNNEEDLVPSTVPEEDPCTVRILFMMCVTANSGSMKTFANLCLFVPQPLDNDETSSVMSSLYVESQKMERPVRRNCILRKRCPNLLQFHSLVLFRSQAFPVTAEVQREASARKVWIQIVTR